MLPEPPSSRLATRLAALIATGQFDIIHSLEFQHAGYLTLDALAQLPATRPIWIATNYGSDISLFGKQPQHQARIRQILAQCDYYSAECHRDVGLAQQLGLNKPVFAICPNNGGIDLDLADRLRTPGPSSARRIVAVKGYQHFAGRALTALRAIDLAREHLAGYQVRIFSPFPEVRQEADRLRTERGIHVSCLPEQVPHQDILRLHGSARVSIAISIGDGVSTALLEAMAMGAFPIQTCTACADEWIEDGTSGFIVQPDDVEQIRRCLITALTDDGLVDRAATLNLARIAAAASHDVVAAEVRAAYARIPLPDRGAAPRSHQHRRPCVLTVITPTYNRAGYLKETIDSVLSQGFPDLQYILMDDGSTDATKALVDTYAERIEYHWHENVGEQRTVNRALRLVQGEYFMIVNSDDPLLPGCLARMVGALRDHPTALAAYPDWQITDAESRPITTIQVDDFDTPRMLTSLNVSLGPGACFRRSVLEVVGLRDPLLRYSADLDYWHRVALAGPIVHVPETLATHRAHPGSGIVVGRGDLMARETLHLYETYSRHPRVPRHARSTADACGHYAAAFVCTDLRSATRELVQAFLISPTTFLDCLGRHGSDATIGFLKGLGGEAQATTAAALAGLATTSSRIAAYRVVARAALRDPVGWLQAITACGLPQLAGEIRRLPQSATTAAAPASDKSMLHRREVAARLAGSPRSPRVTIAMPVYNGGRYFRLALESALAQRYDNVEIIVVNDGSTDGGETERIARDYDDRIRYIAQENRGVGGALNTAVANMTGEYFAWLSHDDLHLQHKTRAQIDYLARLGRRDAILFSDFDLIDPDGSTIAVVKLPRDQILRAPMLPLFRGMINGCTLLIPKHILLEFGPFDESLRHTQDYDLWNRILRKHEFFHQPEVLVQYRVHPGQDSKKPEAAAEGDALWIRMLDDRSEAERVAMGGSSLRFLKELAAFLDNTPYKRAARHAHACISSAVVDTLVSTVIPFHNECELTARAVRSSLDQTHHRVEVVLVNDGCTESLEPIDELLRLDDRVRLLHQRNGGLDAARYRGMTTARGSYIAFLGTEDLFLPVKIQRQMELMQERGTLASYSSYYVRSATGGPGLDIRHPVIRDSNASSGNIGECPIALSTVMIHRTLVSRGFRLHGGSTSATDTSWNGLALHHDLCHIPEPLTVTGWSASDVT
jgi:glycosyltransferase involved in cell wall biosynthesis